MAVLASQLIGKDVFANDEKKIGNAVNVLVDFSRGQVEIIVFPHLVAKLVRDHSGKIAGMIAGQAISAIKHVIPGAEIADFIVDEAGGYAGGRTGGKVKQLFTTIQEAFYSVPMPFLSKIGPDSIEISVAYEECRKWCLNATASPEICMCLLPEPSGGKPDRPTPITLNLTSLKNMIFADSSGLETVVVDVAVPAPGETTIPDRADQTGFYSGIVVTDPRPSIQRERIVPLNSIVRHGDRLSTNRPLDQYPFTT